MDVTVTTAGGTSATSAADQFTYIAAPTVTGVSPGGGAGGRRHDGDDHRHEPDRRHGGEFRQHRGDACQRLRPRRSWSPARPADGHGGRDGDTAGGTSATSSADQFTYVAAPTVTGVSPTAGSAAGGTTVTITGTNLANATAVKFGSDRGNDRQRHGHADRGHQPGRAAGDGGRDGDRPLGGTSATSAADSSPTSRPVVTASVPATGPAAGGTTVTITGTNLVGATAVEFGTTAATIISDSATQIMATSPAGGGHGGRDGDHGGRHVGHLGGRQVQLRDTPTVTTISPAGPATGGTTVTITGTSLLNATAVDFGTTPATIVSDTATQIVVTAPANPAGNVRHGGL